MLHHLIAGLVEICGTAFRFSLRWCNTEELFRSGTVSDGAYKAVREVFQASNVHPFPQNMPLPDEQIFPHATGAAEALVAKHQEPQPLVFYAGWVSRVYMHAHDKTTNRCIECASFARTSSARGSPSKRRVSRISTRRSIRTRRKRTSSVGRA